MIYKTCDCCGKEYREVPPGSWISTINGWHTARIATENCHNEAIGCDNDPDEASKEAWKWYNDNVKSEKKYMKFRKKPVVIEAIQFTDSTITECIEFAGDACRLIDEGSDPKLCIQTLKGDMICSLGDWIIKGVKGEFYLCKPDIFEATYEQVEDVVPERPSPIYGPIPPKAKARIVERTDPAGKVSYVIQIKHWLFRWLWVDVNDDWAFPHFRPHFQTIEDAKKFLPFYDGTPQKNKVILYSPKE